MRAKKMKNLESLKGSKFEAFKSNELQNKFAILGGKQTSWYCTVLGTDGKPTGDKDFCDTNTPDGSGVLNGKEVDFYINGNLQIVAGGGIHTLDDDGDFSSFGFE